MTEPTDAEIMLKAGKKAAKQAQSGAVPLTDEQADAIALESFERHCGRPHPWEGAQPWVIAAIKAAHGIKGKEAGNAE